MVAALVYAAAALWMLLFGATSTSLLAFQAACGAALGAMGMVFARRVVSTPEAVAIGLAVVVTPLIQANYNTVMVDVFLAAVEFATLMALLRFWENPTLRRGIVVGLLAAAALLTKGNSVCLFLVPVVMSALTRDFRVWRSPALYVAGAVAALLGLPWQFVTLKMLKASIPAAVWSPAFALHTVAGYAKLMAQMTSPGICALAVIAVVMMAGRWLKKSEERTRRNTLALALSFLIANFVFFSIDTLQFLENRYIIPLVPFLYLLGQFAVHQLTRLPVLRSLRAAAPLVLLLLLLPGFSIPDRGEAGFRKIPEQLAGRSPVVLVTSDAPGEGALITAVAFHDRNRPATVILRGSKILSYNRWVSTTYKPNFASPTELNRYLLSVPVDYVVIDRTRHGWDQDSAFLSATMAAFPADWEKKADMPAAGDTRGLTLFARSPTAGFPRRQSVSIQMDGTLVILCSGLHLPNKPLYELHHRNCNVVRLFRPIRKQVHGGDHLLHNLRGG